MKKKKHNRTVSTFKNIFNVREWLDYNRLKSFTVYLYHGIRKMVVPGATSDEKKMSFEAAVKEMKLTDEALKSRALGLYRLSLLMCVIAGLIAVYCIYHIYLGNIAAALLSLIVMMISLALACRYHFWYFQIKKRKLGCTLKEWYQEGLLGHR